ncbi:hypothetical protein Lal_00047973 [Lupinus albus]|uniref:Putative pectinesterase inhibitor domain-containing protein n=1 Tax=Lupinus albus TaxID=3870 RepID=A0A6A5N2E9_LUPAL|nr:putative pectinesterase inhibitor domain-containing protein [Lupinus albus]KAF1879299.1 hypothetical protein Lal_00047973 [Lupinus albus]
MKSSSAICSLLFTLGLVLISNAFMHAEANKGKGGKSLIEGICEETLEDKANCMRAVGSDSNVLKAKNSLQLAKAILEIALKKGIEGQSLLKELAASTNSQDLVQCANFDYDEVVLSFRSALGELKDDAQTASYDAAVAVDGPVTCNRRLAGAGIVNPVISSLNSEIMLFSNIAARATDHL